MSSEFKKFTFRPGMVVLSVIVGLLIAGYAVLGVISFINGNNINYVGVVILFAVLLALLFATLIPTWQHKKFLEKLKTDGIEGEVEADFAAAESALNGKLRLGAKYIYRKNRYKLVTYDEIAQVYQYIHKTNFAEDKRELRYKNTDGKTRTLCKLELRGKSDDDVKNILSAILKKNPTVKIGYR